MRATSFCLRIIAHGIATSLALLAGTAVSLAAGTGTDRDASCRIPFETLKDPKTGESFPLSAALNENTKLPENLRQRYIVADLNTADEHGYCRGIAEHFTPVGDLSEFPRLRAIAAARGVDVAATPAKSWAMKVRSRSSGGILMDLMRACASGLRRKATSSMPGSLMSPTYWPRPRM